jgi:hypothetical protein
MIPKTFSDIERILNIKYHNQDDTLSDWYRSIKNSDIDNLTLNDLVKSIRQNLYLGFLMKNILKFLYDDINCGDNYDGELLVSLKFINVDFWKNNKDISLLFKNLIEEKFIDIDSDIKEDATEILKMINITI